jgi:hypothetical protein
MNDNMIFETLKKLSDEQRKHSEDDQESSKRKPASFIYLDEKDNQIKEIPLSKLDSAASVYIIRTMNYKNPAKFIHDSIFGK